MSTMRRLFVAPEATEHQNEVVLPEDEAHYAKRVLRLGPGDAIEMLDGSGRAAPGELIGTLNALALRRTGPWQMTLAAQQGPDITLAVAMPKGERADWLAEKVSELAAVRLQWLRCERSVVEPQKRHLLRIERLMRAAARQARHGRIPEQPAPISLFDFVAQNDPETQGFVLDGQAAPAAGFVPKKKLSLIVGPEGGLSPEELQAAYAHSYIGASLGPSVLRVETAAIVATGLIGALSRHAQNEGRF